jgi:uncharacterized protein YbbC (DUF1343 family)
MITEVLSGADQPDRLAKAVEGKRFGLLTNPTGINRRFESTWEICSKLTGAKLTALFACEHGIRGQRQAGVLFDDEIHDSLGIPVFSLYGKHKKPTLEMLELVDAIVFDIQDLGVRFYTYVTTLVYLLEGCAAAGKSVIVLDRPNPLGGSICEGGLLEPGYESMVGAWRLPFRSGLTIGETALYVNAQFKQPCDLQVIPLQGWNRTMEFPETGLPWIMPSPNMPTMDTVRVYAGTCMVEGTNLSEGRGTTKPFEMIGAPWLDGSAVCNVMNGLGLPGVHFQPLYFTPTFSKHEGELCGGVRLFVLDPASFQSVKTGLHLLECVQQLYPEQFEWLPPVSEGGRYFIDLLTGSDELRKSLHELGGRENVEAKWNSQMKQWRQLREPFLLYGEV